MKEKLKKILKELEYEQGLREAKLKIKNKEYTFTLGEFQSNENAIINKKQKLKIILPILLWGILFHFAIKHDYGNYIAYAAAENHPLLCKTLLFFGSDVNMMDEDGWTPLHWAAKEKHLDICKLLIEKGADANARDEDGRTPLHNAAEKGNLDVCKLLIQHGANVNAKDKWGITPLDIAKQKGYHDIANLLKQHGAKEY